MASGQSNDQETFEFTRDNVQKLKDKYANEMKDAPDNPIKVCMKLIFQSAIEKDPDQRSKLSLELSQFLTGSHGVVNLFLALIDFDTSSQKLTTHNQRFIAVANIITRLPVICLPYEQFCDRIAGQIRSLICNDDARYSSLACIIYKSMIESPHAKGKDIAKIILNPIFEALHLEDSRFRPHEAIIAIRNLLVNHLPTGLFHPVFPNILYIYFVLQPTPSGLKVPLRDSLICLLNDLKPGPACCLIEQALFHDAGVAKMYTTSFEDDGISIKICDPEEAPPIGLDTISRAVLGLLQRANREVLVLEFFFHFQETMWSDKDNTNKDLSAKLIEPMLLEANEDKDTKFDLLGIIASNSGKTLELISRKITNYVAALRCPPDQFKAVFKLIEPTLQSCVEILNLFTLALVDDEDCQDELERRCLSVLVELKELLSSRTEIKPSLAEEIAGLLDKIRSRESLSRDKSSSSRVSQREFDNTIRDLNNKLVPVRVHAIVQLKQQILSNESYAISQIPRLFAILEASLADAEPYVFLSAINLISEMALRSTKEILPKLIELYGKQDLSLQNRINVGEVLVRFTKQLNETAPFYAKQIMSSLLESCQDQEELIRMSSLTNIGEMCRNLGDSLGDYSLEILSMVKPIIDRDTIQVKCAALDLLRTALSGVNRLLVESIQRELPEIYKVLKRVKLHSLDEQLCLQLELAMDEIDRLARELVRGRVSDPKSGDKLVKNLRVCSLNDD